MYSLRGCCVPSQTSTTREEGMDQIWGKQLTSSAILSRTIHFSLSITFPLGKEERAGAEDRVVVREGGLQSPGGSAHC